MKRVCIVGASGKLGRYMIGHCLDRGYEVVGGSDLEEGASQGMPAWAEHVGDPAIAGNLVRRTDFALFMVGALVNDALIRRAPAISRAIA